MNLPKNELLKNCNDYAGMQMLLKQAEDVLRTWQPSWSPFISAPLREEALQRFSMLSDLFWYHFGGHSGAERQRLSCSRENDFQIETCSPCPISGIEVEGNFLFDNPSTQDIRNALKKMGAVSDGIGDIWLRGDKGAQVLCTPKTALNLHLKSGVIREVEIKCISREISELSLPSLRLSKRLTTVEASSRVDAIASAGFGLSRAKILDKINRGLLRLNWRVTTQPSKEVFKGDQIQLEDRGTITVIQLETTKKGRIRVEILRQ